MNNNVFDVYEIAGINKFQIINAISKLVKGTHESLKYVNKKQKQNILIETDEVMPCNVDGEILEDRVFDFRMAPEKITIFNDKELIHKLIVNKVRKRTL